MGQRVGIIIVAGGSGTRMGTDIPKQFICVGGVPILIRTMKRFAQAVADADIVVVLPKSQIDYWNKISLKYDLPKYQIAIGGQTRFDSVKNGIKLLSDSCDLIAVQDGVRPFVSNDLIERVISCAKKWGSAIPTIMPVDSFRTIATDNSSQIIDRNILRVIQTPQIFDAQLFKQAYKTEYDTKFTDDASVFENVGNIIRLCEGERTNIKITTPDDLLLAEIIAKQDKYGV